MTDQRAKLRGCSSSQSVPHQILLPTVQTSCPENFPMENNYFAMWNHALTCECTGRFRYGNERDCFPSTLFLMFAPSLVAGFDVSAAVGHRASDTRLLPCRAASATDSGHQPVAQVSAAHDGAGAEPDGASAAPPRKRTQAGHHQRYVSWCTPGAAEQTCAVRSTCCCSHNAKAHACDRQFRRKAVKMPECGRPSCLCHWSNKLLLCSCACSLTFGCSRSHTFVLRAFNSLEMTLQ